MLFHLIAVLAIALNGAFAYTKSDFMTVGFDAYQMQSTEEMMDSFADFIFVDGVYHFFSGETTTHQAFADENATDYVTELICPEGFCSDNIENLPLDVLNDVHGCTCYWYNATYIKTYHSEGVHSDHIISKPVKLITAQYLFPSELSLDHHSNTENRRLLTEDPPEELVCEIYPLLVQNTLIVNRNDVQPMLIRFSKDDFAVQVSCSESSCSIYLPDTVFTTSGYGAVTAYYIVDQTSIICITKSVWIAGITFCELHDCVVCYDSFKAYECLPSRQKAFLIWLFVVIIVLSLMLFPAVLGVLYMAAMLVWVLIKMMWRFVSYLRTTPPLAKIEGLVTDIKADLAKAVEPKVDTKVIPQPKTVVRPPRANKSLLTLVLVALKCIGAQVVDPGCTDGGIFPATFTNCLVNGPIETCNVTFTALSTLSFIGAKTCIVLQDSNSGTSTSIEVTYDSNRKIASITREYYTRDWFIIAQSNKNCYGNGCSSSKCDKFDRDQEPVGARLDSVNVKNHPGGQYCYRACGCASCGCANCADSCVYHGFGTHTTGAIFDVRGIGTQTNYPVVNVKVSDVDQNRTSNFRLSTNAIADFNGVKITVLGQLDSPNVDFGVQKLIINLANNTAYLRGAAEPSFPQSGMIGDIQAQNRENFATPTRTSFKIDEKIAAFSQGTSSASYTSAVPGIRSLLPSDALPKLISGQLWKFENGSLHSDITFGPTVILKLESIGSFRVKRNVVAVCPVAVIGETTGCFSCPSGMSTVVTLHSVCAPGPVQITADEAFVTVTTPSLPITMTPTEYVISWITDKEDGFFNFDIVGSSGSQSINVEYRAAVYEPDLSNATATKVKHSNVKDDDYHINGFKSFLDDGIAKFFKRIFRGWAGVGEYFIFIATVMVASYIAFKLFAKNASNSYSSWGKKASDMYYRSTVNKQS
jgi:uncharacterized membrane protein